MRQFLLLLFIFPAAVYANAGEIKYPVSSIPENLKKNAHAIKRLEEVRYEIVDLDEAIYRRKIVYTILDEGGERYAPMVVGYDKLVKVTSMEGALYDANGQLLKRSK